MRKKSNLRDSGRVTFGADDLLESAGVAFSKVLQKIEAKRLNITWLAVLWMKLFPWWQRSEEGVQRALSWRRRGDPPEFQVRLLSVKRRKLQLHCPSLIHWCVSNWSDNEFSVLKCSHQSSIHQSAPGWAGITCGLWMSRQQLYYCYYANRNYWRQTEVQARFKITEWNKNFPRGRKVDLAFMSTGWNIKCLYQFKFRALSLK